MDDKLDRDVTAMKHFAESLSDFCDVMVKRSAILIQLCDQVNYAMQDKNGRMLAERLTDMAEDLQDPVNRARDLSQRISRSAAILEALEKGE